jgi:hypothetical protein
MHLKYRSASENTINISTGLPLTTSSNDNEEYSAILTATKQQENSLEWL